MRERDGNRVDLRRRWGGEEMRVRDDNRVDRRRRRGGEEMQVRDGNLVDRRRRRGGEEVNDGATHHFRAYVGRPRTNSVPSGGVGCHRKGGGMTPLPAAATSVTTRGWETDRRRCLGGGGAKGGGAEDDYRDDRHRRCEREDEQLRRRGVGVDEDDDEESYRYSRDRRRLDIDTLRDDYSDHYSDDDDDDDDDNDNDDDETDRRDDDDATRDENRTGSNNSAAWSKFTPIPYHRTTDAKTNEDDDGIAASTSSSPNLMPSASIITMRSSSMSTTAAGVSSHSHHNYRHRRAQIANMSTGATTAKLGICNTNASSMAATTKISNTATAAKIRNTNASSIGNMIDEEEEDRGDMVEVLGGNERGAEGRRRKHHPSRISTPKSHVAVDKRGMNNIDVVRMRERHVVNDVDLLAYWSSLSVKTAIAVMSAGGGEAIARRAANAVLETSNNARIGKGSGDVGGVGGIDRCLQDVATRVGLAILEEGGDHVVATAASVAIMKEMGKKNVEKAKNDAIGCHATPFRDSNAGEKSVRVDLGSVSDMMDKNSMRVVETKKMGDNSKEEDGNVRVKDNRETNVVFWSVCCCCEVKNESQHLGSVEPSTRGDGDDQEQEKGGGVLASKQLELQKMEEEIDRKRKELDDRLARLGTTAIEGGVFDGNRSVTTSKASRRRRLEAENAEILARNKALEEMTATLIRSHAGNVQREIDHRMNVNVVDQSGRSGGMGRVDRINKIHDKCLPPQYYEIDVNRSRGSKEQQREENANLEKGNNCGEITVATPDHSDAPVPAINVHLQRHQSHVQIDQAKSTAPTQQREQTPERPAEENVFKQLTGKFYSIMDGACNDSYYSPPIASSTAVGVFSPKIQPVGEFVTGALFPTNPWTVPIRTEAETDTLCETLTGAMSGLTDETNLGDTTTRRNNANQTPTQASKQPIQNVSTFPDLLSNHGTNHRNGERHAINPNLLKSPRPLNQGHQTSYNHNSSTANRAISHHHDPEWWTGMPKAADQGQVKSGGQGEVRWEVRTADQFQARAVGEENRSKSIKHQSKPSVKSPVTASLTKLKSGLFTQFGKKPVIDEDWCTSVSTSENKHNSTPSRSNSKGQLFAFSRGKSTLFAV